ncbi:uncharacterized protein LOC124162288 [Ischnura elegans]|uniref:uncharacterized protein LOC124162288 n=1 Tax=Ischnura elegans TaxID=197161 RepID=UPI001ED8717D|nr:uncharacterized protein LOC124162288 [Ischnura elegans]
MAKKLRNCEESGGLEEELHEDFVFYLSHTEWVLKMLPANIRKQAGKWLKYLIDYDAKTLEQKKERNKHFSSLLLDMTFGELSGLYAESNPPKPDEPLPPHQATLELCGEASQEVSNADRSTPDCVQSIIKDEESAGIDAKAPEVKDQSKDGRACQATGANPPGEFGSMEYEEGGIGGGDALGQSRPAGNEGQLEGRNVSSQAKTEGLHREGSCPRMNETYAARLLAQRRPPKARVELSWVHDKLIRKVERAIRGETIPDVEIILGFMIEDTSMDPSLAELPPQALRDKLLRRLQDKIIVKKRNMARREEFLREMERRVPPFYGDFKSKKQDCTCDQVYSAVGAANHRLDVHDSSQSEEARNSGQVMENTNEVIAAEVDAEFNQTMESIMGEISAELSSAADEHRRARSAYKTSLVAQAKFRREMDSMNEELRRIERLARELEELQAQREYYSQAISQEKMQLCKIKKQTSGIIESRTEEIKALKKQLRAKKHHLAEVMRCYGERLEETPK